MVADGLCGIGDMAQRLLILSKIEGAIVGEGELACGSEEQVGSQLGLQAGDGPATADGVMPLALAAVAKLPRAAARQNRSMLLRCKVVAVFVIRDINAILKCVGSSLSVVQA